MGKISTYLVTKSVKNCDLCDKNCVLSRLFLDLKWDFCFLINVRSLTVQESMCLKVNIKANFYNCVLVGGRILLFPKAEGCRKLKMKAQVDST